MLWNGDKMEVVHAEKKPLLPCVNSVEARFHTGELRPTLQLIEAKTEAIRSIDANTTQEQSSSKNNESLTNSVMLLGD